MKKVFLFIGLSLLTSNALAVSEECADAINDVSFKGMQVGVLMAHQSHKNQMNDDGMRTSVRDAENDLKEAVETAKQKCQ